MMDDTVISTTGQRAGELSAMYKIRYRMLHSYCAIPIAKCENTCIVHTYYSTAKCVLMVQLGLWFGSTEGGYKYGGADCAMLLFFGTEENSTIMYGCLK